MKVLEGKKASFCYSKVDDTPRERVAGCNVLAGHIRPTAALLEQAAEFAQAQCLSLRNQGKSLCDGYLELSRTGLPKAVRVQMLEDLAQHGLDQPPLERDDCNLAVCTQVSYHNDLPLAGVLGAWCLSGPARDLVFPRTGIRVVFKPGSLVLFDSVQPHGLLSSGRTRYVKRSARSPAELTVFVSFLMSDRDEAMNRQLGRVRYCPIEHSGLPTLSCSGSVDPITGAMPFDIQTTPLTRVA